MNFQVQNSEFHLNRIFPYKDRIQKIRVRENTYSDILRSVVVDTLRRNNIYSNHFNREVKRMNIQTSLLQTKKTFASIL